MAEYQHPELRNLAEDLDDDELGEIAAQCIAGYKADEESRSGWMEMHATAQRLYFQKDTPQNPPWEGSSEESFPMLAEACNQFYSRASQAMFPSRNIIRALPTGKADEASVKRAERVGLYMSYQLTVQDRQYKRDKKRLLLSLPLHGSFFTKSYYCPARKRNIVRNVRATDFVVPYGIGPRALEEIDRKSEIIHMTVAQSKLLERNGYFVEEALPYQGGDTNPADSTQDEVQGLNQGLYRDNETAKLIEQHCLLDIDDDGYPEPYIVTIDLEAEKVLRISPRYDTDEAGNPTDDKAPVEYYTHYSFLENPDGFYGLGFWHLIGQMNIASNKLLRQNIDAGTLRNVLALSGFINRGADVKKGELQMQLGKFVTTSSFVDDFSKSIWQPNVAGQDPTLLKLMETIMMKSDRLSSVTEAVTGQTEAVMQPTTLMALIDQSLQQFSSSFEGVVDSWTDELEKLYRLNYKFMDPTTGYNAIIDAGEGIKEFTSGRDDFAPDMQIHPVADPKLASEKQKLARAEATWQHAVTNPLIVNSPKHLREASRRYLEAVGVTYIDGILPKISSQMPRMDDPIMENRGAISPVPMMPPAFPDQDHEAHIEAHMSLLTDTDYNASLTPEGLSELTDHVRAHMAYMYGMNTDMEDMRGPLGLALPGPNATLPEGAEGGVQPGPGMEPGGELGFAEPVEGAEAGI